MKRLKLKHLYIPIMVLVVFLLQKYFPNTNYLSVEKESITVAQSQLMPQTQVRLQLTNGSVLNGEYRGWISRGDDFLVIRKGEHDMLIEVSGVSAVQKQNEE